MKDFLLYCLTMSRFIKWYYCVLLKWFKSSFGASFCLQMQASFVKLNIQEQQHAFHWLHITFMHCVWRWLAFLISLGCIAMSSAVAMKCIIAHWYQSFYLCPLKVFPKEKQKATTLILKLSSKVGTRRDLCRSVGK